ncbi:MAG TPA: sulfotransferase [Anaerolineales bacterium]
MMLGNVKKRIGMAARALRNGQAQAPPRRQVPPIQAADVLEVKAFFPMEKFFIFGHARSGTTLLTRLVRLHPEVHCNYQAHFFTRQPLLEGLVSDPGIGEWLARRSNRWNRGQDLSPLVLRAAADFILEREARREGKRIVGDKSPNSLLEEESVRLMHKVYPDARLVLIVRDGRDVAVSHRFQQFIDASQHLSGADLRIRADFARQPEPYFAGDRSIFTPKSLRAEAVSWAKNVTQTGRVARELYGDRYLYLRYEDLLESPLVELERIWIFLGAGPVSPSLVEAVASELARNPDADWQMHKAGDLVGPLEKGKRGSWRSLFTASDRQAFKELAGQALVDWGYEQGLEW